MARRVEHIATVVRTGDGVVEVELTAQSACVSCHARTACGMGESARKRIVTPDAAAYVPGECVTVSVERNMGMTAVLWAYVVPFVVLLGALVAASLVGWSDGAAALTAVGGVALCYGALYLFRGRLERKIHFKIHKQ